VEEIAHHKTEHLGHLGLVAAMIKRLKIVDKINSRLPLDKKKGGKVSHGHRAAAMILNGLGYLTRTLYLSPHFFDGKPLELLLGADIHYEDLNDDMLGRHLDAIASYGTTKLFSEIAFEIASENDLLGKSYHLDTTTLKLYGDYEEYPDALPLPLLGYSKDHRSDLKQVTLSLTQTGEANIPLWMESLDGNASDKKSFHETVEAVKRFQKSLAQSPDDLFFVVDAAFYTPEKLAQLSQVKWITRVPLTLNEAKAFVQTPGDDDNWNKVDEHNKTYAMTTTVSGMAQRWVLVDSAKGRKRALKTLYSKLDKAFEAHHKALWHICNGIYACAQDAHEVMKKFEKRLKFMQLEYQILPVYKYSGKGRPKAGTSPDYAGYRCEATLAFDLSKINLARERAGRFILATNALDKQLITDGEILTQYKAQTHVEGGFRFLKSDEFELNHVFLKNPNRIGALMMIMTLCLLVYNFAQHQIRVALDKQDNVLPNQLGKPIKNPTLRWLFQLLSKISVICLYDPAEQQWHRYISNIKTIHKVILFHFGTEAMALYGIPPDSPLPLYDKNQKTLIQWCEM